MNRSHSHPRTRQGKASRIALVAVAALAVLGFAAYQFLLNRPGEAAIAFLPADADVVVTLDTNPSQRQLSVFMKITAALEREGIAKKLDETLAQAFDGKPIAAEIQPHFQRSFAMAAWNPKGQPQLTVTLLSIDDPAAVEASLKTHGQPKGDGSYAIPGTNEQMFAAVVDKYLAVANSEVALMRVGRVRAGAEPSVAKSSAFAAARATLPEDANVMVFLAPRFFENMGDAPGGRALGAATWMAASATVVPEGIQFDYQGPVDASKMPSLAALGQIAPIDLTALKQLPDGAYGVAAYSQGGRYWNSMDESVGKEPALADGFKDSVGTFEKETGLSIAKDLVPALMGEQVLAIYPGNLGQPSDVEGALLLTEAHGANPASLAAKVRAILERKTAESGKGLKFVESKVGEATVWELDAPSRKKLFGLDQTAAPAPQPWEQGMVAESGPPELLANKSLVFAQIGNSLLVTSSRGLVQRAIEGSKSGKTLAEEPIFVSGQAHLTPGAQGLVMVNLKKILLALEPTMADSSGGGPFQTSDFTGLFGDGLTPLVGSGKFDGMVGTGRLLLPFDFEKAIALIGKSMAR